MINLLKETMDDIRQSGHTPDDILFIGSEESGHSCTWDEFVVMADQDYDNGFGGQEVASDLIIVFRDGTKMWRHEYDGSEEWMYSKPFVYPEKTKRITRLIANDETGWVCLKNIN